MMLGINTEFSFLFERLPFQICKHILAFLPEGDLAELSAVSKTWLEAANEILRDDFFHLNRRISKELEQLKADILAIPSTNDYVVNRVPLLRSHFLLELMRSEMRLIQSICRSTLSPIGNTFCIGRLVQEYRYALMKAKQRDLPPWHINDDVTSTILNLSKLFIDAKVQTSDMLLLGVTILDMLDTVISKHYRITVTYRPEENSCVINAQYSLRDPKFLNVPPKFAEENKLVPSLDDVKQIINYLLILVRINNRTILRDEQYYRELELSRRTQEVVELDYGVGMLLTTRGGQLVKEPRTYHDVLPNPIRRIRSEAETFEMVEEYVSEYFSDSPPFLSRVSA